MPKLWHQLCVPAGKVAASVWPVSAGLSVSRAHAGSRDKRLNRTSAPRQTLRKMWLHAGCPLPPS